MSQMLRSLNIKLINLAKLIKIEYFREKQVIFNVLGNQLTINQDG